MTSAGKVQKIDPNTFLCLYSTPLPLVAKLCHFARLTVCLLSFQFGWDDATISFTLLNEEYPLLFSSTPYFNFITSVEGSSEFFDMLWLSHQTVPKRPRSLLYKYRTKIYNILHFNRDHTIIC